MVDVVYKPWKAVVFHEIVRSTIENLVHFQALGVRSDQMGRPIHWVDGIALVFTQMPQTDEIVKEQLEGRIHWSQLAFAEMPRYQPVMTTSDGKIQVPIANVSHSEVFKDLAQWIKTNSKNL